MNSINSSFFFNPLSSFIRNHVLDHLSEQRKRILAVACLALSFLTVGYVITRCYFKAKRQNQQEGASQEKETRCNPSSATFSGRAERVSSITLSKDIQFTQSSVYPSAGGTSQEGLKDRGVAIQLPNQNSPILPISTTNIDSQQQQNDVHVPSTKSTDREELKDRGVAIQPPNQNSPIPPKIKIAYVVKDRDSASIVSQISEIFKNEAILSSKEELEAGEVPQIGLIIVPCSGRVDWQALSGFYYSVERIAVYPELVCTQRSGITGTVVPEIQQLKGRPPISFSQVMISLENNKMIDIEDKAGKNFKFINKIRQKIQAQFRA